MIYASVFLMNGVEEVEAIAVIDILRRADFNVTTISLSGTQSVLGSHQIEIKADYLFDNATDVLSNSNIIVLPGGPGTSIYTSHSGVMKTIVDFHERGQHIAAICAAPTALAQLGITKGRNAVCYPALEEKMIDTNIGEGAVCIDDKIITSRGAGTAIQFAFAIVEQFMGMQYTSQLKDKFVFERYK